MIRRGTVLERAIAQRSGPSPGRWTSYYCALLPVAIFLCSCSCLCLCLCLCLVKWLLDVSVSYRRRAVEATLRSCSLSAEGGRRKRVPQQLCIVC